MEEKVIFFIAMVFSIILIVLAAKKLKVAYPVLLVLAGLLGSFLPGTPRISIKPELIFIIILPPLLYESAWSISWKEMWKWRRIISSFAFLVVFFSAFTVAVVAYCGIPGFTLALGLVLGGIVSPPDAVSAGAILKFVKVPRRMQTILEGESLLNDASSLIIFQFALLAVTTGDFILYKAAGTFLWMVTGGILTGILIGKGFMIIHKILPTDANMDTIITIITPYIMYLLAEEIGSSGVLSVVSGGLFLSYHRHSFMSNTARIKSFNVWQSLSFVLNGWVFILIGLDLPQIISELGTINITSAIGYGLLVTAVLVFVRLFSAMSALVATVYLSKYLHLKVADARNPGWGAPVILGWSGMRGVVSLAAAFSIPVYLDNGTQFPQRNLILFITFVTILVTLLLQGLTLPFLIKKAKLNDLDSMQPHADIELELSREMTQYALEEVKKKYKRPAHQFDILQDLTRSLEKQFEDYQKISKNRKSKKLYAEYLQHQREWLYNKNLQDTEIDEEIIRKIFFRIDLEEERMLK